jgi:hypothetical protein
MFGPQHIRTELFFFFLLPFESCIFGLTEVGTLESIEGSLEELRVEACWAAKEMPATRATARGTRPNPLAHVFSTILCHAGARVSQGPCKLLPNLDSSPSFHRGTIGGTEDLIQIVPHLSFAPPPGLGLGLQDAIVVSNCGKMACVSTM